MFYFSSLFLLTFRVGARWSAEPKRQQAKPMIIPRMKVPRETPMYAVPRRVQLRKYKTKPAGKKAQHPRRRRRLPAPPTPCEASPLCTTRCYFGNPRVPLNSTQTR